MNNTKMQIRGAYYPKQLPMHMLIITADGACRMTRIGYRHLTDDDLLPAPGWDAIVSTGAFRAVERYEMPAWDYKHYGLEKI